MLARTARASSGQAMRLRYTQAFDRAALSSLASTFRVTSKTSASAGPSYIRQPLSSHLQACNAFQSIRHKSTAPQSPPITSDAPQSPPITSEEPASSSASTVTDDRFSSAASEELLQAPNETNRQPIGKLERRLSITFTCTVPACGHRSSHEFSRHAYEKGIVLCQCPECHSRHLIGM